MEYPAKTWKIKQTPIALFECWSCKTKWRRKGRAEVATFPLVTEFSALKNIEHPQTVMIAKKIEKETPLEIVVHNTAIESIRQIFPLQSGI